jgi:hypothetical protein
MSQIISPSRLCSFFYKRQSGEAVCVICFKSVEQKSFYQIHSTPDDCICSNCNRKIEGVCAALMYTPKFKVGDYAYVPEHLEYRIGFKGFVGQVERVNPYLSVDDAGRVFYWTTVRRPIESGGYNDVFRDTSLRHIK